MYLTDYIKDSQTKCFDKHGVFFAFSDKQFDEQKKDGIKYLSLGAGTICPKDNIKSFIEDHALIIEKGMAQDIKENGKEQIIRRELSNHECYYTGDYTDCLEALKGYDFTEKDIKKVFYNRKG